ncbi:Replication factor C subunit 1 [Caenorhabditis elegans]|uniref:Replication factor C subunit 1 n=1 Tax=Caenorhabditis elegans TaxID=6239 RepID=Q18841_CAEEL|nr:Replication factor C subunit 1 [Caenorhabditis elegans]CAA99812.1 Replication factor C subunit 1 [Caenorhabditis elegans]|eukprot:NP_001256606.1 Replication factor C subunit 1 [Caenorhabditis elegans]
MSTKRKIVVSSDSDDDMPFTQEKQKKAATPAKKRTKPVVLTDDDEEEENAPQKKTAPKRSRKQEKEESDITSDEDELVRGTDEKKKRKGGKKELPVGQKTLDYMFKPSSSSSKRDDPKKKVEKTLVNPADFFKNSPAPSASKLPKVAPKTVEKPKTPAKKPVEISPSTKENTKTKKVSDDEFVDSDDSFDTFTPITVKKKTPEKRKETPKKKELPSVKKEFPKKQSIPVKKEKETPQKKALSVKKDPPKVTSESSSSSQVSTSSVVFQPKPSGPPPALSWVDKYKPKRMGELVGQNGDKSPINKLLEWIKDWAKHNLGEGAKIKKPKPAPWMSSQDGTSFKAALLSGSPGVGKTTCAYMACQQLGLQLVEMNASDVRSKKHLEAKIGELSGSHQIEQFFGAKKCAPQDNQKVHHILIMDEVDGMSGNEDRAGISELIQIIKESKIPIICICNDRQHPKIRTLANYCYDLRFPKPRVETIRSRMMTICSQEKMKIGKEELDEIIELSGHDVRQTIYNLQMRSKGVGAKINQKDMAVDAFSAARRLLDSRTTLMEKQEMFFTDYGIMPLFVQDNYLNMKNEKHSPIQAIRGIRKAADFISLGDLIDRQIRGGGSWKLLNEQSMISAALPAIATGGHLKAMIQFPSWLGKNSTAGKRKRLLQQLVQHTHLKVSAGTHSFATDYAPMLRQKITKPLLEHEADGIPDVISTMTEYDLIKDDTEALTEIVAWPGKIDPASKILSKVKASLTRTLNKTGRMLPYSMDSVSKGKKRGVNSIGIEMDEEGNLVEKFEDEDGESDNEDNEEKTTDVVIKVRTGGGAGASKSARGGRGGGRARGGRGSKK